MATRGSVEDKIYHKEYNLKRYHSRRSSFLEKLGNKCVQCGALDNLEFHHKIPEEKEINISDMLNFSLDKITKELEKCELLCHDCHIAFHKKEIKHGSITMYTHYLCRCQECKNGINEYRRKYRENKRLSS